MTGVELVDELLDELLELVGGQTTDELVELLELLLVVELAGRLARVTDSAA